MKDLKFLLLMPYYERPNMVKNALNSILFNNEIYKNWELAFIDDGSIKKGRPVVEDILKDHLDKVNFYYIEDSIKDKIIRGGSMGGKYMNDAIKKSDAEICFWLMDDDALMEDALFNLNKWFNDNPNRMYCYCDQYRFDPFFHIPIKENIHKFSKANPATTTIIWRTKANKEDNIWFSYPVTIGGDAFFYNGMWNKYGKEGAFISTGICTLYRALHQDNLGKRHHLSESKHKANYPYDGTHKIEDYKEYIVKDIL